MPKREFNTVAIVGAGTMGHGMALEFARAGLDVSLIDVDQNMLEKAEESVANGVDTLVKAGRIEESNIDSILSRIETYTQYEPAVEDVELVIEAGPETLEVKQSIFKKLDECTPDDAILATNTSGLSITEIASVVDEPSRVLGTHWFNPPYLIPLVEVVYGEHTSDNVVEEVYELLESIGKTPVTVQKDIHGFIANRIQTAMDYEAWSLLDRGVASAEDIDRAVRAGFGLRIPALGVFRKADFAGLDIIKEIQSYMTADLDRGTDPSESLERMIEEGRYGLKSGEGVFDWSDRDSEEVMEERDQQLLELLEVYESMTSEGPET